MALCLNKQATIFARAVCTDPVKIRAEGTLGARLAVRVDSPFCFLSKYQFTINSLQVRVCASIRLLIAVGVLVITCPMLYPNGSIGCSQGPTATPSGIEQLRHDKSYVDVDAAVVVVERLTRNLSTGTPRAGPETITAL